MLNRLKSAFANRGKVLEKQLENICGLYESLGVAKISKIPTPIKMIKRHKNGTFTAVFEKKSTVDFEGFLADGKHVCFDAKETHGKSFPFSRIEDHQKDYLSFANRCNAMSFVYIRFVDFQEDYMLYWSQLERYQVENKKKSIRIDEIGNYACKIDNLDFLNKMGRKL